MKLKHYLKLGITFCIIFFAKTGNTQNFDNYPQALESENFSIEMIAVVGGDFAMGASENDTSRNDNEKPQHDVTVDDFWMGKHEITWEQYDAFVFGEFGPEKFKDIKELNDLGIDAISGATPPYVDMSFNMGKGNSSCRKHNTICSHYVLQMVNLKNWCIL